MNTQIKNTKPSAANLRSGRECRAALAMLAGWRFSVANSAPCEPRSLDAYVRAR